MTYSNVAARYTERGRGFVAHQRFAARILAEHFGYDRVESGEAMELVNTNFYKRGKIVEIAHIKVRDMTFDALEGYGSLVITGYKISAGIAMSKEHGVPFNCYAYLLGDRRLVGWKIFNEQELLSLDSRRTRTRNTCNGGTAERVNSFLPLEGAFLLPETLAVI